MRFIQADEAVRNKGAEEAAAVSERLGCCSLDILSSMESA